MITEHNITFVKLVATRDNATFRQCFLDRLKYENVCLFESKLSLDTLFGGHLTDDNFFGLKDTVSRDFFDPSFALNILSGPFMNRLKYVVS